MMRRPLSSRPLLSAALLLSPLVGLLVAAESSPSAMATAATRFLASLTPEQRRTAQFAFDDAERLRWHFIPTEQFERHGVTLKEMSAPQRERARELLKAGLSARG